MRPNLLPLALVSSFGLCLMGGSAAAQDANAATLNAQSGTATPLLDDAAQESAVDQADPAADPAVDAPALTPIPAEGLTLEEFLWIARPIVVFADTPADPRFTEQLELLAERIDPLIERDVVIIVDTDPAAGSAIRTALRPRGFSVVVVAKDGTVGLRRPAVRDVREIIRAIDNFQLRQEELRRDG